MTMPSTKRPARSDARRGSKPLVEKRRRARINRGLAELQALVLDGKKEDVRQSRVEKADILEMAVRHVQVLQQQNRAASASTDASVVSKFQAGYSECIEEVSRFLQRCEGLDSMRSKLDQHLQCCLKVVQEAAATSSQKLSTREYPYRVQSIFSDEDVDNDSSSSSSSSSSSPDVILIRNDIQQDKDLVCEGSVWRPW